MLVHAANVFMSLLTSGGDSGVGTALAAVGAGGRVGPMVVRGVLGLEGRGEEYVPNPCSFYLLNLGIDVSSFFHFVCSCGR